MELEKLKVAEASHKAFKNIDTRIGEYIKNLDMQFGNIDADANASVSVGTNAPAPAPAATTWPLYTCDLKFTYFISKLEEDFSLGGLAGLRNLHMDK